MARRVLLIVWLLACCAALSHRTTARAQAPVSPPAPAPIYAPPPPVYAPPYPPPIYAPPPYPVIAPYDNRLAARRARRYRPPYRTLAWRALIESGGSLEGRVLTSVDGRVIRAKEAVVSSRELVGAFDFRLGAQRLFGEWFGLGLLLGYTNWQSGYFDAETHHRRSHYLSLSLVPELRIKLGDTCRHCFTFIAGARVGAALSVTGAYRRGGWSYAVSELGGGGTWGAHAGLEFRAAERLSIRIMAQYEGALLHNRVDYGRLGSELLSFRIDRAAGILSFALGIL